MTPPPPSSTPHDLLRTGSSSIDDFLSGTPSQRSLTAASTSTSTSLPPPPPTTSPSPTPTPTPPTPSISPSLSRLAVVLRDEFGDASVTGSAVVEAVGRKVRVSRGGAVALCRQLLADGKLVPDTGPSHAFVDSRFALYSLGVGPGTLGAGPTALLAHLTAACPARDHTLSFSPLVSKIYRSAVTGASITRALLDADFSICRASTTEEAEAVAQRLLDDGCLFQVAGATTFSSRAQVLYTIGAEPVIDSVVKRPERPDGL
jgi:hypothetical protein